MSSFSRTIGALAVMSAASWGVAAVPRAAPQPPPTPSPAARPPAAYRAVRVEQPPRIDGALDDTAWAGPANEGLVQNEPVNGASPVRQTRWWIAYDDQALYAAFRMEDGAADSIDTAVARRDDWPPTDCVVLELDPYNDDRSGYRFMIGAGGTVLDALEYNDGWDDPSWDAVWQAAARVDAQGWSAEMRIPFSQIRFPSASDRPWGINVSRRCKRNQGRDDLFHLPRTEAGWVSRFADLVGLDGIRPAQNREAWVYGLGKGEYLEVDDGNPFNDGSELAYGLGADLRWGLSSTVTLNASINPDFGQVEVDPAVVNLSDVETFFEEKRPFFIQDSNVFQFGRDGTNSSWGFNFSDPTLFYSRRVGRNPQLEVDSTADFTEAPTGTTILGAAKLTGKLGRTTFGVLDGLTADEHFELEQGGLRRKQLAEPLTNYTALRATREAADAHSAVGVMLTSVQRDLSDAQSQALLARRAYTGGVDGWKQLGSQQQWALRGYFSGSLIQGEPAAIAQQQVSSRRYFQRPDADHLRYDPTRTALAGWTSRLMLNRQKGDLILNTAFGAVSPGYEINDLGFQYRSDILNYHLAAGRRWTHPNKLVRHRDVTATTYWTWDFGGTRNGGGYGLFYYAEFANYWSVNGNFFFNPSYASTRLARGGPVIRTPDHREFYLAAETDPRRMAKFTLETGSGAGNTGEANAWAGVGLTLRPSSALSVGLRPSYSWEQSHTQYLDTIDDPGATATFGHRYVFSDLEYREVAMSARFDCAFTPRLTLQGYVQPLIATGGYSLIKELARAGAYAFRDYGRDGASSIVLDPDTNQYTIDPGNGGTPFTLDNPDFSYRSLRVNLVLRWEYRPGSTFFLVWTRNGTDTANPGSLEVGRDFDRLLSAPSDDVVIAKLTTWLDF